MSARATGGLTRTPEEHRAAVLETATPLAPAVIAVGDALGLGLAEHAHAQHSLPLWDNSAMDGYAVRASDLSEASVEAPVALRVVGEVAAGDPHDPPLAPGECVRIMTGAPLPSAADAVVPVEDTAGDHPDSVWAERQVRVHRSPASGAHVRRSGEDVRRGDAIAHSGERLSARKLAALAAAGVARVSARPRPRIAVVATGAELRPPGAPLERGQISESNSVLISGLLAEDGWDAREMRVANDDAPSLARELDALARSVDLVITTGGVGPGKHDVVRLALADEPHVHAVRVAVKPGQPQCAGRLRGGALIFALPGNPVSAAVSYELFVRPAILQLQGITDGERPRIRARAEIGWRGSRGRLQVLPVRLTFGEAGPSCAPAVDTRGYSHAVGSHGAANGYALVGPERGGVDEGDVVDVIWVGP